MNDLDTSLKDLIMKRLKKKTFYSDLEELGYSSKDFENLKVKDLTSEANSQLRRGSTHSTTEPVTLKEKLGESESRQLPASANRGVANSPTRRVGESLTPRLSESGSRHGESPRLQSEHILLQGYSSWLQY